MMIKGVYTALVTPFTKDGKLDEEGFRKNIRLQIKAGVDGIVPLGTTGESPTLNEKEQERVATIAIEEAKGKIKVMVGTGSYCTEETIHRTKMAKAAGADAAMIMTPYYNRPSQEGIFRHFEAVTKAVKIPLVVYNIAGRTGQNITTATLARIAKLPNLIGVKEASGSLGQMIEVADQIVRHHPGFALMCGDDLLTLPLMSIGGVGIISVISNLVPEKVVAMVRAAAQGKQAKAQMIHCELLPLIKGAFLETNPIPIKTAMTLCGLAGGPLRLPMCEMSPETLGQLKQILKELKLV